MSAEFQRFGRFTVGTYVMRAIYLMVIAGLAVGAVPLNNAVAQSSSGSFEQSVDFPGHNYRNTPSQEADECRSTCEAENRCRAWTYDMFTRSCWLKDAASKRVHNTCCISGIKNGASGQID